MKTVGLVIKNHSRKSEQTVPAPAKSDSRSKKKTEPESEPEAADQNEVR